MTEVGQEYFVDWTEVEERGRLGVLKKKKRKVYHEDHLLGSSYISKEVAY